MEIFTYKCDCGAKSVPKFSSCNSAHFSAFHLTQLHYFKGTKMKNFTGYALCKVTLFFAFDNINVSSFAAFLDVGE